MSWEQDLLVLQTYLTLQDYTQTNNITKILSYCKETCI